MTHRRRAAEALAKFWGDLLPQERKQMALFLNSTGGDPWTTAMRSHNLKRYRTAGRPITSEVAREYGARGGAANVATGKPNVFGVDPKRTKDLAVQGGKNRQSGWTTKRRKELGQKMKESPAYQSAMKTPREDHYEVKRHGRDPLKVPDPIAPPPPPKRQDVAKALVRALGQ